MFLPSHAHASHRDFCVPAGKVPDCQTRTDLSPLLHTSTSLLQCEGPPTKAALTQPPYRAVTAETVISMQQQDAGAYATGINQ